VTPPLLLSSSPANAATGIPIAGPISGTFDEALDPASVTALTFVVTSAGGTVTGKLTVLGSVVSFVPDGGLLPGVVYTVNIGAITDLAGNVIAPGSGWSFTTKPTPLGPGAVDLGSAANYVILAESGISTVPDSVITGDVGISPAAHTYLTGFSMTRDGTRWTSNQVLGSLFAANNDDPTPANLTIAIGAMHTAYVAAAGKPGPDFSELDTGLIGGRALAPGLYKWTSNVSISSNITVTGTAEDTWVFQIAGNLLVSANKAMILAGGALPKNIVWQVAGFVDLGTEAHAEGIILAKTNIALGTQASINGRLLSQTAVTLLKSTVTAPAP
jgi:hypothetical protein